MEKKDYFSKVTLTKDALIFNEEAVETMELDQENSSVVMIEVTDPKKEKNNKDILIIKTNGSLCDDPEVIKDVATTDQIRKVFSKDGGFGIPISKQVTKYINDLFGVDKVEFKLLPYNMESSYAKEFKETFNINSTYYKLVYMNDKRTSIGKDKSVKKDKETIKL